MRKYGAKGICTVARRRVARTQERIYTRARGGTWKLRGDAWGLRAFSGPCYGLELRLRGGQSVQGAQHAARMTDKGTQDFGRKYMGRVQG
jgi:hypothetical protein